MTRKLAYIACLALLASCQGSDPFARHITFQGSVRSGHLDTNNSVVPDTPLPNATVTCEGFSGSARTGSDGSYQLSISCSRTFDTAGGDGYTVTAQSAEGLNETMHVTGKPGDTVVMPAFVLYRHTEAQ